ncbi:MAG: hypothetical protein MRJ65_03110 [Candidatus Brocadiaceae bacterium]|nr:hypothetical protein [Candidatus Brocadiaceae bacterium]
MKEKTEFFSRIFSLPSWWNKQSIKNEFRHAFSLRASQENKQLEEEERALVLRLVAIIRKRKLTVPAAMFLECIQPLNYIGSQAMVFFRPFLTFFFSPKEYDILQGVLEKREGINKIIEEMGK